MKHSHWPLTLVGTMVALIQLMLPLIFVRIFPVAVIGEYKIFFLYLALLPLLSFSAGFVHGVYYWVGRSKQQPELCAQAWTTLTLISLALMLGGMLYPAPIARLLDGREFDADCFVVAGALALMTGYCEEMWIAQGRVLQSAAFRGVIEFVRAALIILVAWQSRKMEHVYAITAGIAIVRAALGQIITLYQGMRPIFTLDALRAIARYALPVSAAGFLAGISGSADQILLSQLLTREAFAVFAMGCLTIPPLLALEQSVNQVLTSRLAPAIAQNDMAAGLGYFQNSVKEIGRLVIPSFFGLLVFAEPIVRILFTDKYLQSASVLRLYAFTYLLFMLPYDGGPRASGAGTWALKTFFVKTLVALAFVTLLTPVLGVYGAMSGVLASGIYLRGAGLRFNRQHFGWTFGQQIPWNILRPMILCSAALSVVSVALRDFFSDSRVWFVVCGGTFFVIYGSLFLMPKGLRRRPVVALENQ